MHRVDTDGHVANRFVDADPVAGTEGTIASQDWLNDVQENLALAIEGAGIPLVKGAGGQLLAAINALINAAKAEVRVPVGFSMENNSQIVPAGWYEENGAEITRAGDPALWAYALASGNLAVDATDKADNPFKFGPGNGATTFQLPDKRGLFKRVWDHGAGRDPGRGLGTSQADAMQGHVHPIANAPTVGSGFGYSGTGGVSGVVITATGVPQGDGTSGTPRTASETRPANGAVMSVIKR